MAIDEVVLVPPTSQVEDKNETQTSKVQKLKECFEESSEHKAIDALATPVSHSPKSNDAGESQSASTSSTCTVKKLHAYYQVQNGVWKGSKQMNDGDTLECMKPGGGSESDNVLHLWQLGTYNGACKAKFCGKKKTTAPTPTPIAEVRQPIPLKFKEEPDEPRTESPLSLPDIWAVSDETCSSVAASNEANPATDNPVNAPQQSQNGANEASDDRATSSKAKDNADTGSPKKSVGKCELSFKISLNNSSLIGKNKHGNQPQQKRCRKNQKFNQVQSESSTSSTDASCCLTASSSCSLRPDSSSSSFHYSVSDEHISELIDANIQDLMKTKNCKEKLLKKHKMREILELLQLSLNEAKNLPPNLSPPPVFNFANHSAWPAWKVQFLRYLKLSGLDKSSYGTQLDLFLYLMNGHADKVLKTFPKAPKNIEEVIEAFTTFFRTPRNIVADRVRFNNRHQMPGETIDSFLSSLKILSEFCEYGPLTSELVRDRFIAGLRSRGVRMHLLKGTDMSMDAILSAARNAEIQEHMLDSVLEERIERNRYMGRRRGPAPAVSFNRRGRAVANRLANGGFTAPFWKKAPAPSIVNDSPAYSTHAPRNQQPRRDQQHPSLLPRADENIQSLYHVQVPLCKMPISVPKSKKLKVSRAQRNVDSDEEDDYGVAEELPTIGEDSQISVEMADVGRSYNPSTLQPSKDVWMRELDWNRTIANPALMIQHERKCSKRGTWKRLTGIFKKKDKY